MWSKGQLTFVARSRHLVAPLRGSLTFWRVCAPVRHPQMKMTSHILHLCNFCTITWSGCLMLCSKFYLFLMFGEPRALWLYFSVTMWLGHGGSYWDHIHVQLAGYHFWVEQEISVSICDLCTPYKILNVHLRRTWANKWTTLPIVINGYCISGPVIDSRPLLCREHLVNNDRVGHWVETRLFTSFMLL